MANIWSNKESGAAIVDYVIALAILGTAFIVGGLALQKATEDRAEGSRKTIESMVPCKPGGPVEAISADACK